MINPCRTCSIFTTFTPQLGLKKATVVPVFLLQKYRYNDNVARLSFSIIVFVHGNNY